MAILGIDEVGRGPWAGPLVVGACVLNPARPLDGLADSKKLTPKRREALAAEIRAHAAGFGLGWVSAKKLDEIGLSAALKYATRTAVRQINTAFSEIIIDGTQNFLADTPLSDYVQLLKKADTLVPEVSAASIIAKVARDEYMIKLADKYPNYGFEKHVGYGTAAHRTALLTHGPCPEHRHSFRPIAALGPEGHACPATKKLSPKTLGDRAESTVAAFLESKGHRIIARNWRTRFCEIDIISSYTGSLYFTEVKYRRNTSQSSGEDAIDSKKLQKMHFAAELYLSRTKSPKSARLAAAAVSGDNYKLTSWIVLP